MDVLAEINGRLGVLDIKTSYSIFRDYGIQTSAYVEALNERRNLPELTRWILRLDQSQKCLKCPAVLRTKGGNIKVRGEKEFCNHQWSEKIGEAELKELAQEEYDKLKTVVAELEEELKLLLVPEDPNDTKNFIMEIRAGTGGEEAALFASDL